MPGPKFGSKKNNWAKQIKLAAMKKAKDRLHIGAKGMKKS